MKSLVVLNSVDDSDTPVPYDQQNTVMDDAQLILFSEY